MVQVYYKISYKQYKEVCHRIPNCVGHSDDETLTDDSELILKVTGEDHIHLYLEQQGIEAIDYPGHTSVPVLSHPIMKRRG